MAGVNTVTSTTLRHLAATKASEIIGLTNQQQKDFLEHIGHSKEIDTNIYSCPPAARILTNVVPILEHIHSQVFSFYIPDIFYHSHQQIISKNKVMYTIMLSITI